jgi:RNA polymerase sigma-70 factor (ECF subfamily)
MRESAGKKAFEILVREHHRRILAYALALTEREDAAEDIVQEAFVVAYRKLAAYDPKADFGNWVRGIVKMKYLEWRRARREQTLEEGVLERIEACYRGLDEAVRDGRGDVFDALDHCLGRLETMVRRAVDLFYFEGCTSPEVGVRLGVGEGTVRKQLQRARADLAECVRRRLRLVSDWGSGE